MKKRSQHPDAYTYSLLLRGLARNSAHVPTAVAKALSLYHGMSGPASRVSPSIIHTNAALLVCARAHDMDALWSIANSIPETGPNTADHVTFTTIFNALKADAELSGIRRDPKTHRPIATPETIIQARQLWGGIKTRWRSGELMIDENMVCAMGRLLLIGGRPQDWDDVLSLVEQTMDIQRRAPTLRSGKIRDEDGEELDANVIGNIPRKAVDEVELDAGSEFAPIPRDDGFAPIARTRSGRFNSQNPKLSNVSSFMFAIPTNQTLSLVLEACEKMVLKRAADKYWAFFTDRTGPGIKPDSANCHSYLRIMRTAKSSQEAVQFIRTQMHLMAEPKTYRIAMSTCVRNKLSPNVMIEAAELMDMMTNRLGHLDLTACCMWMELGLHSPNGKDTLVAVERLGPQQINLPRMFKDGDKDTQELVRRLLRLMSSGLNRILEQKIVRDEVRDEANARMRKIDGYITAFTDKAEVPLSKEEVLVLRKKKKLDRYAKIEERVRTRKRIEETTASDAGSNVVELMDSHTPKPGDIDIDISVPVRPERAEHPRVRKHEVDHETFEFQDRPRSFSDWKAGALTPNHRKRARGIAEPSEQDVQSDSFQIRYGSHKYISKRKLITSSIEPRIRNGFR
jgi:hypothetical protein